MSDKNMQWAIITAGKSAEFARYLLLASRRDGYGDGYGGGQ